MAVKTKEKEQEVTIQAILPDANVHHMVRRLGVQSMPDGTQTAEQTDEDIRAWLRRGYRVAFVHPIGVEPNGVNILYILIKDA